MVKEQDLKQLVMEILSEMSQGAEPSPIPPSTPPQGAQEAPADQDGELPDLTQVDIRTQCLVPSPKDPAALMAMKAKTPARIGVWRAGPRYKTETLLRFRADHAAAQDAVFSEVSDEFLAKNDLQVVKTECADKDQFLTRPDLGRRFSPEATETIKRLVGSPPKVLVYISDGLSTTAVETNAIDTFKAMAQALDRQGIKLPKPFFVKYGRVPAMDVISQVTGAEVVCVLIGERPGLVTAESMSAYITYKGTVGMPEAKRTVVSNIHSGGTPAVEAGGYVAEIIKLMLEKRASGIDLKL
ncbi:ethanolamine ammonia-lyase subunit EutC [Thermanaerovibrio acidaminovorans]|jgi:ethanolamine ammonia-lyase small subunit|uniref:ethanolamine ammonia-lyase subunit EutC n=1 Tax=Thermanaerovibrio acidaminovorans TaxID=81462 RepID=UPI00249387D3|nr:ethanolamine ammonia-lyase subunit EutC [Thermanaerovibrio acidaminovorans]